MTAVNESVSMIRTAVKWALLIVGGVLSSSTVLWAQPSVDEHLTNQLLLKLQQRDQIIADLQRRVQQLEQRVGQPPAAASVPAAAPIDAKPAPPAAKPKPPVRQAQATQAQDASPKPKPKQGGVGSFEVDEDAAERALERTLVRTGALLLPFGLAEIQPFATYDRYENTSTLYTTKQNNCGGGYLCNVSTRQNFINAGLFLRVGLPHNFQAEFRVPMQTADQSSVYTPAYSGAPSQEVNQSGYALGDIQVGLANTLMREDGWLPDLVGRVTYNTGSGKQVIDNVLAPTGYKRIYASLVALKRQDPLAFTGTLSYQKTLSKRFDGAKYGDQFGLSVLATLSASPQTSLSLGLQQTFVASTRYQNASIPGSNTVISSLTVGAASMIGKRLFFSAFAGIGLTKYAPDYYVNIAIPLRFDVPFKSLMR